MSVNLTNNMQNPPLYFNCLWHSSSHKSFRRRSVCFKQHW